ncbi:DJ-1/PfpI family protein [Streptomyces griseofuscus]|uniref:GlxA family transcriptional regulator n=1 Tax=Streptomyces griseofuscus TaxID=146922 RepID=UPI00340468F7
MPGYWDYRRPPAPRGHRRPRTRLPPRARIAWICTGAFTLAAAGLLNGRTVTTHWASAGDLEDLHPHVSVDRNVLYIDDCQIPTSAGVTAGIDLCLYLVHKDVGAAVANEIARELVVAPRRRPGPAHTLSATRDWALQHLDEPLTLDILARRARISTRTLVRMWRQETGHPALVGTDRPHRPRP